jgi:hypothetical protein
LVDTFYVAEKEWPPDKNTSKTVVKLEMYI